MSLKVSKCNVELGPDRLKEAGPLFPRPLKVLPKSNVVLLTLGPPEPLELRLFLLPFAPN